VYRCLGRRRSKHSSSLTVQIADHQGIPILIFPTRELLAQEKSPSQAGRFRALLKKLVVLMRVIYKNECSSRRTPIGSLRPKAVALSASFSNPTTNYGNIISLHFHFDPSLGLRDSKGFSEDRSHMNIQMHTFCFGEAFTIMKPCIYVFSFSVHASDFHIFDLRFRCSGVHVFICSRRGQIKRQDYNNFPGETKRADWIYHVNSS